MKSVDKLNQLEKELDYFDYLVSAQKEPNTGIIQNIEHRIKTTKNILKKTDSTDVKTTRRAARILEKFEMLKKRYYLMNPSKI